MTPDMYQMFGCGGMSLVGKMHPTFLQQTKNLKIYGKNSGFSLCLNLSRVTYSANNSVGIFNAAFCQWLICPPFLVLWGGDTAFKQKNRLYPDRAVRLFYR
ncbi:MAG TPA: hypothetical protein ENI94_00620 [Gammaproteobacteria bacterium]|nr:hypothetical protein [Gammaproteobacteria bacterium]